MKKTIFKNKLIIEVQTFRRYVQTFRRWGTKHENVSSSRQIFLWLSHLKKRSKVCDALRFGRPCKLFVVALNFSSSRYETRKRFFSSTVNKKRSKVCDALRFVGRFEVWSAHQTFRRCTKLFVVEVRNTKTFLHPGKLFFGYLIWRNAQRSATLWGLWDAWGLVCENFSKMIGPQNLRDWGHDIL